MGPYRTDQLAIAGGQPVRNTAFAPWPSFDDACIEAASAVLRSGKVNYWTGEEGHQFEKEYAEAVGRKHAIALANGTVALELALYVLGIGPRDEVITTSRTFIASASCIVMRGATPVLADVDPKSGTMTAETIRPLITSRTKAIIVVHLAGWPCDMDPILQLAKEYGLKVIEDCAQAHGACYKGKPVGCFGDVAAFSFCQDKIITTAGEGGLLLMDDEELREKAWAFKDHGKSYDAVYRRPVEPGFRWLHESFGTNWRMTEIQAAIGRVMLRKLPSYVETRRRNAAVLAEELSAVPGLVVPMPGDGFHHSYYKFYAYVDLEALTGKWTCNSIREAIQAEGVPCLTSCSEIYLEKAFPSAMRPPTRHEVARRLGESSLMFLVHPTLNETDMRDAAAATKKVLAVACGRHSRYAAS